MTEYFECDARTMLGMVLRFAGMTNAEAINFRYATETPPVGVTVIIMRNAPPPTGHPENWWSLDRGSDQFWAAFGAAQLVVRGLSGLGL